MAETFRESRYWDTWSGSYADIEEAFDAVARTVADITGEEASVSIVVEWPGREVSLGSTGELVQTLDTGDPTQLRKINLWAAAPESDSQVSVTLSPGEPAAYLMVSGSSGPRVRALVAALDAHVVGQGGRLYPWDKIAKLLIWLAGVDGVAFLACAIVVTQSDRIDHPLDPFVTPLFLGLYLIMAMAAAVYFGQRLLRPPFEVLSQAGEPRFKRLRVNARKVAFWALGIILSAALGAFLSERVF